MKKSREERIKDLQAVNKYFKQHIGDSLEIYINGETKSFKLLKTGITKGNVTSLFHNEMLGEVTICLMTLELTKENYVLIIDNGPVATHIETFGEIGKEYLRKLENYYNANIETAKKLKVLDLELPFNEEE